MSVIFFTEFQVICSEIGRLNFRAFNFGYFDVQPGSANRQTSFSGLANAWKKTAFFRAHCQQVLRIQYSSAEHRRPHYQQNERSSLPCSAV